MTRQEVINELELVKSAVEWEYPPTFAIAIDQAIKYIQAYDDIINNAPNNSINKKGHLVEFFAGRMCGVLDAVTAIQDKIKEIENG